MSIFFYHVSLSILPLSFIIAFLNSKNHIKNIFLSAICGVIFGILSFKTLFISHVSDNAKIFFDILCIICLFLILFRFKITQILVVLTFLLALCYGYEYEFISSNFKIFASDLLNSLSLSNLFMSVFGFLHCICVYFLLKIILKSNKAKLAFFVITICILIIVRLGFLSLSFMQLGVVPTYSNLLSIVAKIIYFNEFLPLYLAFALLVLALFSLANLPKKVKRDNIIEFRIIKSIRINTFLGLFYSFLLAFIAIFIALFYILIASKPPKISNPIIVEPINGEFKFDVDLVLDNELHRYAYITDDGHKVRFFLLNRFPDKIAPVAVFDACSICGDMGYVKKGDELICISCNVRIFLPSVGKAGGCNPIPLKYDFDGKNIIISLEEIQKGYVFFSEIVKKEVVDLVSGKKITNDSKFSYLYYGRTYFFENAENQAKFEENPNKFLKEIK